MQHKIPQVVVVGAGFAGIEVVKTLRALGTPVAITLVSDKQTFEYYPALYKLVTGALPIEVSVNVRTIIPDTKVSFIQARYEAVDQNRQVITVKDTAGVQKEIIYDYLVVALGSETNFFNIKGLPELSHSFKSVRAALELKKHFFELFSKAKDYSKEQLVSMLHVIIVGGGPSGVELAGDLRSHLTSLAKSCAVDPSLVTIDLIEANNRVLPTFTPKVSAIAEARLRKMGVNIFVNRALAAQEVEEVILKDMSVSSHTVIWTAGTRINSAFMTIPTATFDEHKRIIVSANLTLPNDNNIFIAGDGAATQYGGLAQTAIDHGAYIGHFINKTVRGHHTTPHKPKEPSFVVPIGTGWALFVHRGFVLTGWIPWFLRTLVDVRYFFHIVPIHHVFNVFRKGHKYRKLHGGCSFDA